MVSTSVFAILVLLRPVPDSSRYILLSLKDGRNEQRKPLHTLAFIVYSAFLPLAFVSLKRRPASRRNIWLQKCHVVLGFHTTDAGNRYLLQVNSKYTLDYR